MNRLVRILNTAAFCCSAAAVLLIALLAFGWADKLMDHLAFNRTVSNLVAGYSCCYGMSQWIQKTNFTLAIGLMVIGTLIIAANIVSTM